MTARFSNHEQIRWYVTATHKRVKLPSCLENSEGVPKTLRSRRQHLAIGAFMAIHIDPDRLFDAAGSLIRLKDSEVEHLAACTQPRTA